MIDIKILREKPETVQKAAESKGIKIDMQNVLDLDEAYRKHLKLVQDLREERNKASKEKDIEKGREVKKRLSTEEVKLKEEEEIFHHLLLQIPNIPNEDVKVGRDESANEVIKTYGDRPKFDFKIKNHLEIGERLDIIDVKSAAKVSGTRFAYLKNEAVLLEFALVQFALNTLIKEGFIPIVPPALIKRETMQGLGYMEDGGEEDMFVTSKDELFLIGTAEQSLVPIHKDETFNAKDIPRRYVGFSPSFRREAGSYGKDTKGIIRLHQFDKVEMVSFVKEEDDDKEHEYLLSLEEKFFQALKIPYQVVKMCTGDLGFPIARKYDIEVWIPSQEKYRELTSASTTTDFQARRLNIKYQDGSEKKYAHILNGTAFAIGRTIVAILENYQKEDGSVVIPEVLKKYVGKDLITPEKS